MTSIQTFGHDQPLTASDVRAQVNLIQEVMRSVMKPKEHYGTIPGCGTKPSLFKPGAEKIMATFRIAAVPEVEDLSTSDEARYRVMCKGVSASGVLLGVGVGECSSKEKKYNWRAVVSLAEWEATPEDRRRIHYTRDSEERQVRTNHADIANTILKMAKKRALVDMVLTATAASDIFTQDIEDDEVPGDPKPEIRKPQKKSQGSKQPQTQTAEQRGADTMDGDATVYQSTYAEQMHDGDTARIQGTLAWDPDAKTTGGGKEYYLFKLRNEEGGQPVSFSHWGGIPEGLSKGSTVIFDCTVKSDNGKVYRNAENLVIL